MVHRSSRASTGVAWMAAVAALVLVMMAAVAAPAAVQARVSLDQLMQDDMPYDMSAVEEMEGLTQQNEFADPLDTAHVEVSAQSAVPASLGADDVAGHRFFSESDVESFLEQRETMNAEVNAREQMKLDAKHKAEAEARAKAEAKQRVEQQAKQAAEAKARVEAEQRAAAEEAKAATAAAEKAAKAAEALAQNLAQAEQRGIQLLERAESLARAGQPALLESQSKASSKAEAAARAKARVGTHSKKDRAWWQSRSGVATNFHHYKQGMQNALIQGAESITNAESSYALPLGKKLSQARINQQKSRKNKKSNKKSKKNPGGSGVMSALEVEAPQGAAPAVDVAPVTPMTPVATYGTAPASAVFDPHNGAAFHPPLLQPMYAPKLPEYMAESRQPWAGAGYYGSGGGRGPHPGSEAFVPLPGVSGKEFGIRAREAWEVHAQSHPGPASFHSVKNQPEYPWFPSWSRKSEVGGRPDLFPRPMANLAAVTAVAQRAAAESFRHSNAYYQQYNRQATVPMEGVVVGMGGVVAGAGGAAPGAGPRGPPARLLRQVIGYPRPAPPASRWGPTASSFPAPLNSASFSEQHNYAALGKTATLGVPLRPADLRNVYVNNGPNAGLHPAFGAFPQYVPAAPNGQQ